MLHYDILKATSPVKHIENDIAKGTVSNSYMINSADEPSLNTVMKIMTMKLMCKNNGCGVCDVCKMIGNNNMADVYILDKPAYKVEDVNELVYDTILKSIYRGYKVYMINGSERLTAEAQNKLLKTVEEPPENCLFLFGVGNDAQILPTLKSRCVKLALEDIDREIIKNEMINLYKDSGKAEIAAASSAGSLTKADRVMNDNAFIDSFDEIINILKSLKKSAEIISYLNNPVFSKDSISGTFDIIEMIIRDIMVIVSGSPSLAVNKHYLDDLIELSKGFSKDSAVLTLQLIYEAREKLQYYCNATSVADSFLFKMLEVKYLCRI